MNADAEAELERLADYHGPIIMSYEAVCDALRAAMEWAYRDAAAQCRTGLGSVEQTDEAESCAKAIEERMKGV